MSNMVRITEARSELIAGMPELIPDTRLVVRHGKEPPIHAYQVITTGQARIFFDEEAGQLVIETEGDVAIHAPKGAGAPQPDCPACPDDEVPDEC